MLSLDPDFLRTFLAISEAGGFAAAAEAVNKTQSTVSAQVRRLEGVLDARLFEKEGRRNVLTPQGRQLLEYARAMVRLNDETISAFRPPAVSGSIRIGAIDEYAQAFFPEVLSSFGASHPAVQVEVVTGSSEKLLPSLESESLDAVIVSCRVGDPSIELLRADQLHWIGGEGRCAHLDTPLPMIAWSEGCTWRDMATAELARVGRPSRLAFTTSNASLVAQTLRNGLGVAVAPRWFLSPGLTILEALDRQCPLGRAEIGIKRRAGLDSPALEAFLGHLKGQLNRVAERAA